MINEFSEDVHDPVPQEETFDQIERRLCKAQADLMEAQARIAVAQAREAEARANVYTSPGNQTNLHSDVFRN